MTLELLQEHGYDRLALDAVATTARASKATLYRRWPTKAELVLAAFVEGTRQVAVDPDTGTLRGDLLATRRIDLRSRQHPCRHHPGGARRDFPAAPNSTRPCRSSSSTSERRSCRTHPESGRRRGEIAASAITEDLWDVLPGYIIYRSVLTGRAPSRRTVQDLVDNVLIPSLTRHNAGGPDHSVTPVACSVRSRTVPSTWLIYLPRNVLLSVNVSPLVERVTDAAGFDRQAD